MHIPTYKKSFKNTKINYTKIFSIIACHFWGRLGKICVCAASLSSIKVCPLQISSFVIPFPLLSISHQSYLWVKAHSDVITRRQQSRMMSVQIEFLMKLISS